MNWYENIKRYVHYYTVADIDVFIQAKKITAEQGIELKGLI